jgi:hypothetical protein
MPEEQKKPETVRLNFDVSPELAQRTKGIPWGIRSAVFRRLVGFLMDAVDKHGYAIYGAIIDEDFALVQKEKKNDGNDKPA